MSILIEIDKAWLACAIDSEGSIAIGKGHKTIYVPTITLSNTHQEYMARAEELINRVTGNSYTGTTRKSPEHKIVHRISVSSFPRVIALLKEITPYLIAKKNRAENLLAWNDYRKKGSRYDAVDREVHKTG